MNRVFPLLMLFAVQVQAASWPLNDWSTILCAAQLTAGRWHLATLVADAQKALLYLNGKLVGEVRLASPITATAAPITLGGIWDAGAVRQAFYGAVDEFSFQSRALSATEIAASYQPISVTHDVPKLALGLPLWDATKTLPKAADLPHVAGAKFYVLKRQRPDEDGCNITLGVGLVWHKGKLYASYGFNKGNENTVTEEAHVRVSDEDHGRTWTPAAASNLPMATSKPYAGTLSNGQRYLVRTTTANTGGGRSPLTIDMSKPGESVFSKVFLIRTSEFEGTPGVSRPNIDFSYPYAVEHEGQL